MGIGVCAFNGLYNIIVRDADTAAGGVTPSEVVLHAPGFYRHFGDRLDTLMGDGLDRKVQIVYDGTLKWINLSDSVHSTRMRQFNVTVRIGYFAGSHVDETMIVMADDEQAIAKAINLSVNWPTNCTTGCVNGYITRGSSVLKLDDTRYVLEMKVEIQVSA